MADTPRTPFHGGIAVVRYSETFRAQWENFVAHSNQGTLFHTRAFLAYHPHERFKDASLLFFKKKKLLAVLPAALVQKDSALTFISHPGASFGGFVAAPNLSLHDQEALVTTLIHYCRAQNFSALELSLPPLFYHAQSDANWEYTYYRAGFRFQRRELTQAVRLDSSREQRYDAEFQRQARRAQKLGVVIQTGEKLADFYEILQRHLTEKHGANPTHSLTELLDLQQRLPGRINLFAACVEARMIAGFIVFLCNARVAMTFYIGQRYEDQHYRAINLLTHEAMNWCERKGFTYLDFGTSTINLEPNWGLIKFREAAGARGFWRDRLRLEL